MSTDGEVNKRNLNLNDNLSHNDKTISRSANPTIHVQLPDSSTKVTIKEDLATVEGDGGGALTNCNLNSNAASGGHSPNLKVTFGGGRNRGDLHLFRAPSPVSSEQQFYLALPSANSGRSCSGSVSGRYSIAGATDGSTYYTDEKMLIKSLEVLANALGFKKSFSTNDILGIENEKFGPNHVIKSLQRSQSVMKLSEVAPLARIEASSRSLSTWVAVGDTSATTQLPSPQVGK